MVKREDGEELNVSDVPYRVGQKSEPQMLYT